MSYAKIFGRNLRWHREQRQLSQAQLSARLDDIPVPYISSLEHGKENPTLKQLERFANALGLPLADLLDRRPLEEE